MDPGEYLLTQLDLYVEESQLVISSCLLCFLCLSVWSTEQEDMEELRYRSLGQPDDQLEYTLTELARLAQEHSDLYPVLVDTVKRYVLILERDIDK